MRELRVLHLANTLATVDGGAARASLGAHLALARRTGVRSKIIWLKGQRAKSIVAEYCALFGDDRNDDDVQKIGFTRRSQQVLPIWEFLNEIHASDVVVINGFYLPWIPIVATLCRFTGTPYVLAPHGALTPHQSTFSTKRKAVFDYAFGNSFTKASCGFVVASNREAAEIKSRFNNVDTRVGRIGVIVPQAGPWLASEKHQPLRLITVSRLARKKRCDLVLDATKLLLDNGRPVVLDIVGSGDRDIKEELEARVAQLGITDHVNFRGELLGEERDALLRKADIFLLPSDDENFGIAPIEALSLGVPCVVSKNVGSTLIVDSRACRISDRASPEDLKHEIEALAEVMPYSDLREEAREAVQAIYDWSNVGALWERELRDLSRPETR